MPRIYDNIDLFLSSSLRESIEVSFKADICVGYFNLRGWKVIQNEMEKWEGGENKQCRLLIGMQNIPHNFLKKELHIGETEERITLQIAANLKNKILNQFREQLTFGLPTDDDEKTLRILSFQLKSKKVVIKLFLRHPLHAKLYLAYREDHANPIIGYLGSSNLTFSGLSNNGELNIDVLDNDAGNKLKEWFKNRWEDRWCLDITDDLAELIDESWARDQQPPPYHIYLKIAYHLAQEARSGISEFKLPKDFEDILFEYQTAAVKIAAHHLHKRNGVLIGDVVGLGKTLMATAVAKIFEDDFNLETLIICPKNLVEMWEDYAAKYRLRAKILPISRTQTDLIKLRRYRVVIIDESHNLRNKEGKRYKVIQDYIYRNESRVILLTATPYNKTYLDLSNQLRLFVPEEQDIGIKPEEYLRQIGEIEFHKRHQAPLRSLAAFEKSEYPDDWRELMRLYLVRRTRSFIIHNYAQDDAETNRKFLKMSNGALSYFPARIPKTLKFQIDEKSENDQYAQLYSEKIVTIINSLNLPRYGLGNYIDPKAETLATETEKKQLDDLSRAGKRLMGFCRTNLFKRLESSGYSFILSIERHILRNQIFLNAIENKSMLPIGSQEANLLDVDLESDKDYEDFFKDFGISFKDLENTEQMRIKSEIVYKEYQTKQKKKFRWVHSKFFKRTLKKHLTEDCYKLWQILNLCQEWLPDKDNKLKELIKLIESKHTSEKILVFSQFADTIDYLYDELKKHGIKRIAKVTGDTDNPTDIIHKFSPVSNDYNKYLNKDDELRVVLTTDILSEGQNLQDCFIVVNFDLPWAIIRLIQRAGRVDRIGQKSEDIYVYSFLPAEGVEKIIKLRKRVRDRLQENNEVVGSDEAFFEDQQIDKKIIDLYNENSQVLDDPDAEVDLASYAYQIWKDAIEADPTLEKKIVQMPSVVYSTKQADKQDGVLLYMKTADDYDALSWIDTTGKIVTESQFEILKAARCEPETPAVERLEHHHDLVRTSAEFIVKESRFVGGQLGRPTSARYRVYNILKRYMEDMKDTIFDTIELEKTLEEIYKFPLRELAKDILNRQLKTKIADYELVELVLNLREEGRLCIIHEEKEYQEPQIICSMGLRRNKT